MFIFLFSCEQRTEWSGERPRPWSGPSHSCPEPTDEKEMTKAHIQDEDFTIVETTEEVEPGETEGEAEETEGEEVESGVQEAPENSQSEPASQPSPQEEVLQMEVLLLATHTDATAGQEKVSSRKRRNVKPGDPASTQRTAPPLRLQDFSFKIATRYYIALLFLLLVSTVNSNPIPARQCALCLNSACATHILRICKGDDFIWLKGTSEIENCFKDSLKSDEPCQLLNGSLVVQSDQPISFEGKASLSGGMEAFLSANVSCADLDLLPGPKSLPTSLVNTTTSTTTAETGPPSGVVAIGVVVAIVFI
ncbi:uncharacterized protein LOC133114042 [Conger conger]|uniref:uncharacterized protein LOC133114042 n=1 Tax=Conger conger TaxID=82655 RepID=UPI002A59F6B7|nr:uncharacterized protein LOC133114042 [Conger conger]